MAVATKHSPLYQFKTHRLPPPNTGYSLKNSCRGRRFGRASKESQSNCSSSISYTRVTRACTSRHSKTVTSEAVRAVVWLWIWNWYSSVWFSLVGGKNYVGTDWYGLLWLRASICCVTGPNPRCWTGYGTGYGTVCTIEWMCVCVFLCAQCIPCRPFFFREMLFVGCLCTYVPTVHVYAASFLEWVRATILYSRLQKSCNKQAEQWKTTIDLLCLTQEEGMKDNQTHMW